MRRSVVAYLLCLYWLRTLQEGRPPFASLPSPSAASSALRLLARASRARRLWLLAGLAGRERGAAGRRVAEELWGEGRHTVSSLRSTYLREPQQEDDSAPSRQGTVRLSGGARC